MIISAIFLFAVLIIAWSLLPASTHSESSTSKVSASVAPASQPKGQRA